jgi:hypothetical protein
MTNIKTTASEISLARFNRYARKKRKRQGKRRSVWTVSGGLPSLGKRK